MKIKLKFNSNILCVGSFMAERYFIKWASGLSLQKTTQRMFEQLGNKFPLDDEIRARYIGYFRRMDVPAKTVLLKEGEIAKRLFLVEKGCLRAWFNNEGKDLTFQFFLENSTVASLESFRKEIPSLITIEAIEPSVVWYIHKKDAETIISEISGIPALRDKFINAIFERTFDYMKHFFSFIKDTPEQRYLKLMEEKPEIIKRVPQHYIASFLGVSTVHLSRIKSKIAKESSRQQK